MLREKSIPPRGTKDIIASPSSNSTFTYGKPDPQLYFALIGVYSCYLLVSFLQTWYFLNKTSVPLSKIPLEIFLVDFVTVVFFIYLISRSARYFLNKQLSWRKVIFIHILLAIIVNAGIRFFIESYMFIRNGRGFENLTLTHLLDRFMAYINVNYLVYFVMIFIIFGYYYKEKIKQTENQKRVLETELLNTKLKWFSAQLQPHFLFNTLNSVVTLIGIDQEKAKKTVIRLSHFLRQTLALNEEQLVPAKIELELLDNYIGIIETRFEDRVKVTRKIDVEVLTSLLPFLIIQPIVENSVKHGFHPEKEFLEIDISFKKVDQYIEIQISNNGRPAENPDEIFAKGTGLSNIDNRLKGLYDNDYIFRVRNLPEGAGICSFIRLPYRDHRKTM